VKRYLYLSVALLTICATLLFVWQWFHPYGREPVYKGKPLGWWLAHFYDGGSSSAAEEAFRGMGCRVVPLLLQEELCSDRSLRYRAGLIGYRLGVQKVLRYELRPASLRREAAERALSALHRRPESLIPCLVRLYLSESRANRKIRYLALREIGNIGPSAASAIPFLVTVAGTTDEVARGAVFSALGQIHTESSVVVPVLVHGLHDTRLRNRILAACALAKFGAAATKALPALAELRDGEAQLAHAEQDLLLPQRKSSLGWDRRPSDHELLYQAAADAISAIAAPSLENSQTY
jgi:hypothetical protein